MNIFNKAGLAGTLSLIAMIGCASSGPSLTPPEGRFKGEQGIVFDLDALIPRELATGHNYSIQRRVPLVEYQYMFTLNTPYGTIPAQGRNVLELRIQEMDAIERASGMSDDPHIVTGVLESFEKTGKGLLILLTDPAGALERAPTGFGKMIQTTLGPEDRRAGSASRRHLAVSLGCDPETRNPILKELLDQMALRHDMGTIMALPLKLLPGVSVLQLTSDIKQAVASMPPSEINAEVDAKLMEMGVNTDQRKAFRSNTHYTATQRLLFLQQLERIRHVSTLSVLVGIAAEATSEAECLGMIQTVRIMGDLNEKKRIHDVQDVGLPMAVLDVGINVLIVSVDYINNTQEISDAVDTFRQDNPNAPTVLITSGRMSERAKKTFESAKIQVVENGVLSW